MELNRDRITGVIILLIGTGLFYEGLQYPNESRIFPLALLGLLMIGAIILIARAPRKEGEEGGQPKKVLLTTALCLAYVVLVEVLGFFLATSAFMAIFMAMMGIRRPIVYVTALAGINIAFYLLFVWQLNVPVPVGILFE
jgi:hypothetical protein